MNTRILTHVKQLDWVLLGELLVLAAASIVTLGSSGTDFFWRQLLWYTCAFAIILGGSFFDWRKILGEPWVRQIFYWGAVLLLLLALFQSGTIRGTKSWLVAGGFQFEPVELAKLALIFLLTYFFSRRHVSAWQTKNLLISLFYTLVPVLIVLRHPDFGSAAVMVAIWFGFILMSGIHKKRFLIGLVVVVVAAVSLWMFALKPYQKDRIIGFISPERDPLGVNYNVIQSKIAIGSGGWFGKGFGGGTQTHLRFLPEAQTDFLFAAFVEEWGIVGGGVLLITFLAILFRLVTIGLKARDNAERFLILGSGVLFLVHFTINVGSNVGLTPVAGITFPFFTYGGSHLLTTALLIGIIENIQHESR